MTASIKQFEAFLNKHSPPNTSVKWYMPDHDENQSYWYPKMYGTCLKKLNHRKFDDMYELWKMIK